MEQNQITKIAWDLNEQTPNRYELVYNIAELAKRMIDEATELGADAIVGIRFGSSAVMQGAAEIIAYGTAVKLK